MKALLFILIVLVGGTYAAGYRVHPENLKYYFKKEAGGQKYEVVLKTGMVLEGVLESDSGEAIEINTDGAILPFKKAEIDSMKPIAGRNFIESFTYNFKLAQNSNPLITKDKSKSISSAFNNFAEEHVRIAEKMQKDNPGLSATKELEAAMAANARARQAAYKAQQAAAEAPKEENYLGYKG